jgi:hypothetical protein
MDVINQFYGLAPQDEGFRARRVEALGTLSEVLTQRSDRDLAEAGVRVLELRAGLPAAAAGVALDRDGRLAEHLYRSYAQSNDAGTVAYLRSWLVRNAAYRSPTKHRVLRTAVVATHWDVVLALFVSGDPGSAAALVKAVPAEGASTPVSLGTFVARRIRLLEPVILSEVTEIAMQHLVAGSGSLDFMLGWCTIAAEEAVSSGTRLVDGQGLRAALSAVKPTSDAQRARVNECSELAHQLK